MKNRLFLLLSIWIPLSITSQNVLVSDTKTRVKAIDEYLLRDTIPFFSIDINGVKTTSLENSFHSKIKIEHIVNTTNKHTVSIKNITNDTLYLSNFIPLGSSPNRPYITGLGDHWLSRTHLFLPNQSPINIIVPDNAWEMGYSTYQMPDSLLMYAVSTRKKWDNATRKRFVTIVNPNGSVTYDIYFDYYRGAWQEGIKKCFQEKKLYDLGSFENHLFERKDLEWIRKSYVMHLIMAWDNWFYDSKTSTYQLKNFIEKGKKLYGGDDVIGIWPTWPTLGLDERNQFDLFKDLPNGLKGLKALADECRQLGTKFFICYNPWDESTTGSEKGKNHLLGLSKLIEATDADGVVLDTRGASSKELQEAADAVKKGVVMYSEGMAIPKDMPGIVSGRVHNALYYPPLLNLNKLIKPEFAIFRVAEIYKEPIRREFATSFFNGYGTELNVFKNGKPDWLDEQYKFLGRTSRILRENTSVFTSQNLTPIIPTLKDKIYVNRWQSNDKTIFTVFSLIPEGFKNILFEMDSSKVYHYIDVWHHKELTPLKMSPNGQYKDKKYYAEVETEAFNSYDLGTNNEGAVDCIIRFKKHLTVNIDVQNDSLHYTTDKGDEIKIWAGLPAYDKEPIIFKNKTKSFKLSNYIGRYEGKIIVQVFENQEIIDEKIVEILRGTPRLVKSPERTFPHTYKLSNTDNMALVPIGNLKFSTTHGDDWVTYPDQDTHKIYSIKSFYIDKQLVTNNDFNIFLKKSKYKTLDTTNFLRHWPNRIMPPQYNQFPVVNISYEDACAYCASLGKRLPTEQEWQYAAQYPDARLYPWGNNMDSTKINISGKIEPINIKNNENTLGIKDLIGNVWQLTHDTYQNGSYQYIILKGGSYFNPTASWWYVKGGAQTSTYRQILLRVSQGFERNNTVGFRCVRDTN